MCHKRTMQSLCVSTFVTVVEVLRDNRMKLSLLKGHSQLWDRAGSTFFPIYRYVVAVKEKSIILETYPSPIR